MVPVAGDIGTEFLRITRFVQLYRAAVELRPGLVLLERGPRQLLPGNWAVPPAAFVIRRGNARILLEDRNEDGLPFRVRQIENQPVGGIPANTVFHYNGGANHNPHFRIATADGRTTIGPGDTLELVHPIRDVAGTRHPLRRYFEETTHVHGDNRGNVPPAPGGGGGGNGSVAKDRIIQLYEGIQGIPPIVRGDSDKVAVGMIQDLLRGHGFTNPKNDQRWKHYGTFGPNTEKQLRAFLKKAKMPAPSPLAVGSAIVKALVDVPMPRATANLLYLHKGLGFELTDWLRSLVFTTGWEAWNFFDVAVHSKNTKADRAGLSFGIIHWAQRPKRMAELADAMHAASSVQFRKVFGNLSDDLRIFLNLTDGGLHPRNSSTPHDSTDDRFKLESSVWLKRFKLSARKKAFQKVQVEEAIDARKSEAAQ